MNAFDTLHDLLTGRYSCRAYLPDPVPQETISSIVEAARHVPSWCNSQPWQVIITKGKATDVFRDALYEAAENNTPAPELAWPENYPGVYGARRRACGFQLYEAVGISKVDRAAARAQMMRNYRLFDAPHVAIITAAKVLGPYGAMDTGGFVTAFCLAARAKGVATIPQAAVVAQAPFVREHFDIPEDRVILCAISFGYADPEEGVNGFRTERADVDDIIDWRDA